MTESLVSEYGFLLERCYEDDEDTFCRGENCRHGSIGSTLCNKFYNCQHCGGRFCEQCHWKNVNAYYGGPELPICCKGCYNGQAPGDFIRRIVKEKLQKIASFANENGATLQSFGPPLVLPLKYGYSPTPKEKDSDYFEFANKTTSFCCIKVLIRNTPAASNTYGRFLTYWELARPNYIVLPPASAVHGFFPRSADNLEVFVLQQNPYPTRIISIEDANDAVKTRQLQKSKCAFVHNFRQFSVFRIDCIAHRSVVLKFKGQRSGEGNVLLPRVKGGRANSLTKGQGRLNLLLGSGEVMEKFQNICIGDIQLISSS